MKRTLVFILLIAAPFALYSQLRLYSSGNVSIKRTTENPYAYLTSQKSEYSGYYNYNIGILCGNTVDSTYNIGTIANGSSAITQISGSTYGVLATAGNATPGYNYAVFGRLTGTRNGAAIFGTTSYSLGKFLNGRYAGYFSGDVFLNSTLRAKSVVNPSDIRLIENVALLKNEKGTLANVMNMNVLKYNYIGRPVVNSETTQTPTRGTSVKEQAHYGLSAQELRQIFPALVYEGQDGYLAVNYIEMVPILIRTVQELKQKLDIIEAKKQLKKEVIGSH